MKYVRTLRLFFCSVLSFPINKNPFVWMAHSLRYENIFGIQIKSVYKNPVCVYGSLRTLKPNRSHFSHDFVNFTLCHSSFRFNPECGTWQLTSWNFHAKQFGKWIIGWESIALGKPTIQSCYSLTIIVQISHVLFRIVRISVERHFRTLFV